MRTIHRNTIRFCIALCLSFLILASGKVSAAAANEQAGTVKISSGWLNVRSGPSTSAGSVAQLQKGSYVTLISKSDGWWKVEYEKGKFGYCHGDYITVAGGTQSTVATQSGSLNVRSGAGTSYARIGALAKGEQVIVLSSANGWSRVVFHGSKTGYVSSQYLSGGFRKISIDVPNLKQMDARWADKPVGDSGKPFSQIGCATTAIAMIESHRRGYTIYPDVMAAQLRYTPSGSVYWPSDYIPVTQSSGYLQRIYQELLEGRVVLFGAQNASGRQHWVVVTGFAGGTQLTPSGFSIQDPGSNSRGNLQQLLNEYPTFYKFFCYK